VRTGTPSSPVSYRTYVRFHVSGLPGAVTGAVLRLQVTDGSADGGDVFAAAGGWDEGKISWNTAPPLGARVGRAGAVALGNVDIPLDPTAFTTGDGDYSFALASASTDSAKYASREAGHAPLLLLSVGDRQAPAPPPPAPPPPQPPPPPPPPPSTGAAVFTAASDAQVKSTSATTNYGTATTLRVRQGTSSSPTTYRSYLKFVVSGVTRPVVGAALRLTVTGASPDGGSVYPVANTLNGKTTLWNDANITWSSAPLLSGAPLARAGAVAVGSVDIDLGTAIRGDGTYSFALAGSSTTSAYYKSREAGAGAPQLILRFG
jgi:hypothetical protein